MRRPGGMGGGGNVIPVSDAHIPVSYGTEGHSQPPRPWLRNAVSELNAKNIVLSDSVEADCQVSAMSGSER